MTTLVVGDDFALFLVHDAGADGAQQHLVEGILEVAAVDQLFIATSGGERCLVDQVGQVGSREAGGAARQAGDINVGRQRNSAAVDFDDRFAAGAIGQSNGDLPVETAGAQQGGI